MNDIIDHIHHKEALAFCTRNLKPRYKAVWLSRVLDDLTYKQIGERFGFSQERARQLVAKCELVLRQCNGKMAYEQIRQELGYE